MKQYYLELFNDSFERCRSEPEFMDRFYDLFTSGSAEVRDKFRNTDMEAQKRVLLISLSYMMIAHHDPTVLDKTAKAHSAGNLNIEPRLYVDWLNSMVEAVRLTDTHCSDEVLQAWRAVMQPGIDYMIQKYDS